MRVSIARIRLYLKTGKTLADGTHPIMLMCSFNGKKEVSTSYSCSVKFWDKKSECVRRGFPNYAVINHEINKLKQEAILRRAEYERLQEVYTPSMILCPRKSLSAVRNDLNGLIREYIGEKHLMNKTVEKWWVVYRSLVRFSGGGKLVVNELDESFCRRYASYLESEGLGVGSIRSYLGKIGAICHYAISKGLMASYPFSGWKYHLSYRESKSELYINHRSMDVMMDMFLDEVTKRTENGMWHYRDDVLDKLMDIHSSVYAHYLFVAGYYMKGLSPVDLSLLKKVDLKVLEIRGIPCYGIDGHRSKTGMAYKIRLRKNCLESQVLIGTMLMFHQGEHFLPTIEGYTGKDVRKRVNNLYTYHSGHLVEWFQRVNEEIVRRNMEGGDDIPLIDLRCRYYAYRHSYIMSEVQKPGCNLLLLAQSVGKSAHTLHQYISLLDEVDML